MVGDWVNITPDEKIHPVYDKVCVVCGKNGENAVVNDDVYYIQEGLVPVPLTEKILNMNHFRHDEVAGSWSVSDFPDVLGSDDKGWQILYGLEIRWVHELQQALRLYGLNYLANNFKIS